MKPVLNTFLVMIVATSVYAVLGVGLYGERPDASKYFGHFSESFFTMFQCVSGDGWATGIARPMFESAEETCTYRDETGMCVFDIGVASFFLSYILIVVTVILNVVLAVLLDEFLKAHDQERERTLEMKLDESASHFCRTGEARGFSAPLDPFLKYLSEFHNSDEMAMRIQEAFNLFDCNKDGVIDFLEVKVGLERQYSKVKLLEEDWRDITNHGELCGDNYTLTSQQFFEVMHNQVTLYVQRVASKAQAIEEESTIFVLKYLVTAIDDLRSTMISMQKPPYTPSVYRGQGRGRRRKGNFPRFVKHKGRNGLTDESASYQATSTASSRTPSVGEMITRKGGPSLNFMAETQELFSPSVEEKITCTGGPSFNVMEAQELAQELTTSDINISSAPELICKQPEVNSTCEPNTALTNFKTRQSQRPRNQMYYSKRAVPDIASKSTRIPSPHEPQVAAPRRDQHTSNSRTPDASDHIKERTHSKVCDIH